jgi:hypothetical protein
MDTILENQIEDESPAGVVQAVIVRFQMQRSTNVIVRKKDTLTINYFVFSTQAHLKEELQCYLIFQGERLKGE